MSSVSNDEGLIRAVCERPLDDYPRLVYAEALEDRGEYERAEFIRVQCALAKLVEPRWEASRSSDGSMWHIRWSVPNPDGSYLWLRHYPAADNGMIRAEADATRLNVEKRHPWESKDGTGNIIHPTVGDEEWEAGNGPALREREIKLLDDHWSDWFGVWQTVFDVGSLGLGSSVDGLTIRFCKHSDYVGHLGERIIALTIRRGFVDRFRGPLDIWYGRTCGWRVPEIVNAPRWFRSDHHPTYCACGGYGAENLYGKALTWRQPVTRVELTDTRPQRTSTNRSARARFMWHTSAAGEYPDSRLPEEIIKLMPRGAYETGGVLESGRSRETLQTAWWSPSITDAEDAVSLALLEWARCQNGLPSIPVDPKRWALPQRVET